MTMMSVSDLARNYQMRNQNAQLKATLATLTEEVTTGLKSDVGAAISGDHRALSSVNAALARLDVYEETSAKASLFLSSAQTALSNIQSLASDTASALLASGTDTTSQTLDTALSQANDALSDVLSGLNTTVAGRYLFSGTAAESPAIPTAASLLATLESLTAGTTDTEEITSAVNSWFDAAAGEGGYIDSSYGGSEVPISGLKVSDETTVSLGVTAADSSIRNILKGLALAALAAASTTLSDDQKLDLANNAAQTLLSADAGLVEVQARLGSTERAVESATTRNSAEKTSLSTARTELIGADAYDSSTALQAVQTQLETLYTLTSQLSELSLVNYL